MDKALGDTPLHANFQDLLIAGLNLPLYISPSRWQAEFIRSFESGLFLKAINRSTVVLGDFDKMCAFVQKFERAKPLI